MPQTFTILFRFQVISKIKKGCLLHVRKKLYSSIWQNFKIKYSRLIINMHISKRLWATCFELLLWATQTVIPKAQIREHTYFCLITLLPILIIHIFEYLAGMTLIVMKRIIELKCHLLQFCLVPCVFAS